MFLVVLASVKTSQDRLKKLTMVNSDHGHSTMVNSDHGQFTMVDFDHGQLTMVNYDHGQF